MIFLLKISRIITNNGNIKLDYQNVLYIPLSIVNFYKDILPMAYIKK